MTLPVPSPLRGKRPPSGSRAYISGVGDYADCAAHLVTLGYNVDPPASDLRASIRAVLDADFVVLLPSWQFHSPSNVAVQVAKALRLPLLDCGTLDMIWQPW